ncbi:unnamed protein product [Closterium sp. Yama58-4]|nr:unnamed protein product [Closterium sp. Yama58-4]
MSEDLFSEIEQLAPKFADGNLESLDPLQRVISDLLLKSKDRTWLESDADVAGGIAVTRLINLLPDFSRHCPELYGLQRSSDVSGPSASAADGCHGSASSSFIDRLSTDWSVSADPDLHGASASPSTATIAASEIADARGSSGVASAQPAIRPLVQVLRVIRNLLAGLAPNQNAFLQCGALDAVATIADRLISSHIIHQTPLPGAAPSGGNLAAAGSTASVSAASAADQPRSGSHSSGNGEDSTQVASQLAKLKVGSGAASGAASSGSTADALSSSKPAPASASASATGSSAPSARMLNRPPALATSAGGASASAAHRRKRSINRKGTGTLSLPLLSPSAASFGALPGAASPAGGAAALAQGSPMAGGVSGHPMTPMSPMFYSSLLPPASPSVLHLALQIDLPRDHVDALKAVLQVIGNFANAGELHQTAVWDRCFPGTFSRLATVRSPAVQRALCMVLFTCCRAVPKHVDGLGGSMDGVALLAGALRAQGEALVARAEGRDGGSGGDVFSALPDAASNGMDEWLGLLVERLCLRARYFEPVFKNLPNFSPRPALGQVRGLFCPEQAALLWVLWGALHATAKARGIPGIDLPSASNEDNGKSKGDETSKEPAAPGSRWQVHGLPDIGPGTLKFLLTACRNAAAGLSKAREEAGSKALASSSTSFTCLQLDVSRPSQSPPSSPSGAWEPFACLPPLTMPYVPPHRRAAASSSAAEPAAPSAAAPNLVDDFAERSSSITGGPCSGECACNGGRARCNRMVLRFQRFHDSSQQRDWDQNLAILARVPETERDNIESAADSAASYSVSNPASDPPSDTSSDSRVSNPFACSSSPLSTAPPTSLSDNLVGLLARALEAAHRDIQLVPEIGRRGTRMVERCKLMVKLGKLLLSPSWKSSVPVSLPSLPPFTAGAFESHVNRRAIRLSVPVFRSYDTGLPENLFAAVEDMAIECGVMNMRYKARSRYHIWIADTELEIEYKLICVPDPDNSGIILTKVKHNSVRYAVIDIARPSRAIDFRLLLYKESRLCSLDDSTRFACESIASTAVIDRSARGGLVWPGTTTAFAFTLLSTSSSSASPSSSSPAAAATPTTPPHPSSQSVQPSPSRRFRVMGCWHLEKSRAESGGRLWKLARINGLGAGQVGSSLKHQIDLCPLAWRETTKVGWLNGYAWCTCLVLRCNAVQRGGSWLAPVGWEQPEAPD